MKLNISADECVIGGSLWRRKVREGKMKEKNVNKKEKKMCIRKQFNQWMYRKPIMWNMYQTNNRTAMGRGGLLEESLENSQLLFSPEQVSRETIQPLLHVQTLQLNSLQERYTLSKGKSYQDWNTGANSMDVWFEIQSWIGHFSKDTDQSMT